MRGCTFLQDDRNDAGLVCDEHDQDNLAVYDGAVVELRNAIGYPTTGIYMAAPRREINARLRALLNHEFAKQQQRA